MTNAVFEEGLTRINAGAFKNYSYLTSVTIPSSVEYIGAFAFLRTGNLTNAVFQNPDGWQYYKDDEWKNISSAQLSNSTSAVNTLVANAYEMRRQ